MKILAIETSCDETAVAVLEIKNGKFNLLSNIVSSQEKIHAKFGGIVPEVAARKQMEMIIPVINQACQKAKIKIQNIDYLAVTQGPGLITSLTVGVETAKTLAFTLNKPLIAVNHLAGHIYSSTLKHKNIKTLKHLDEIKFPVLSLIVSGGHTQLVLMNKHNNYKIIGQTVDDAVGEAFDKIAKILNLGYPGGPVISKLAASGDPSTFDLPRPMIQQQNFNFSFSGLKTAVLYLTQKQKIAKKQINNLCSSFQQACIDVLISKTLRATKKYKPKSILLGGGVSANPELRKQLQEKIGKNLPDIKVSIPELKFTGDNAAMIAIAAYYFITKSTKALKYSRPQRFASKTQRFGRVSTLELKADPNLPLLSSQG